MITLKLYISINSMSIEVPRFVILACFLVSSVLAFQDFKQCDVAKGSIIIDLSNLEYNRAKKNEVFRIKWLTPKCSSPLVNVKLPGSTLKIGECLKLISSLVNFFLYLCRF